MANLPIVMETGANRQAGAPDQKPAGGVSRKVSSSVAIFFCLLTSIIYSLTNLQDQEYLKVRLTGYFDAKSEPIFIFPRPLLKESKRVLNLE